MAAYQYIPVFNRFYNPIGSPIVSLTSSVLYNGTNETGGTPPNPSYSLAANMTVSAIENLVWEEFVLAYTAIATNITNISTNTSGIAALVTALANLKTSSSEYDGTVKTGGTPPNPTYSMTTNEALNSILVAVFNEFTAVYTAITGIGSGVSQTTLNNTLKQYVTDFSTGFANTSNTLLVATVASGIASIGGQYVVYAGGTIGITATQDNYVYAKNDGTLTYKHVNNGSGQPSTDAGTYLLWKQVTDGTHVTTATDKRNPYPFSGAQLATGSIPAAALSDNSIALSRLQSSITDLLMPTTSNTGSVLVGNGGGPFVESTNINVGTNALGIGKTATSGLDVAGSGRVTSDGRTDVGVFDIQGNRFGVYDAGAVRHQMQSTDLPVPSRTITGNYFVDITDYVILVNDSSACSMVPPDPSMCPGQFFIIKDISNNASTHNITLTPAVGLIDGAANYVINTNRGSATLFCDGAGYWVISAKTS